MSSEFEALLRPGGGSGGAEPVSALESNRSQRRRIVYTLLLAVELGLLFSVVVLQFFGNWDTWSYYNEGQLFTLHLVGLCLALALEPMTAATASYVLGLLLYRVSVLAMDVLVLSREGRALYKDDTAANLGKTLFVVFLSVCSLLRLIALSMLVHERRKLNLLGGASNSGNLVYPDRRGGDGMLRSPARNAAAALRGVGLQ
jgi:hypothetical protein